MTETYRIRSDDTWARARDDYLAGMTAEQVCRRYDLGLRAFRDHARAEGWRRVDQPDPEPDDADADFVIFEDFDIDDLQRMSRRRMIAATVRGDAMAANRWRRVYEMWRGEVAQRARRERAQAFQAEQEARQAEREGRSPEPPSSPMKSYQEVQAVFAKLPAEAGPECEAILHDLHSLLHGSASSIPLTHAAAAPAGPP